MNATQLKLIAVVCMTLDHLSTYLGAPLPLRYIGRLAAVIFFFCAAESAVHTSDRKNYLRRLYKMSLLMTGISVIVPFILSGWFTDKTFPLIDNNIFASITSGVWLIDILESTKEDRALRKQRLRRYILFQLAVIPFVVLCEMLLDAFIPSLSTQILLLITAPVVSASMLCSEGGLYLTIQILLFYLWRDDKKKLTTGYIIYCALYTLIFLPQLPARVFRFANAHFPQYALLVNNGLGILGFDAMEGIVPLHQFLLNVHFQCFMIFALPLLLLYNGKRGKGLKRFFYVYYPAHILILYLIAQFTA